MEGSQIGEPDNWRAGRGGGGDDCTRFLDSHSRYANLSHQPHEIMQKLLLNPAISLKLTIHRNT